MVLVQILAKAFFPFFRFFFSNHGFLHIGLFSFIPTAASVHLHKVLHSGNLYSSLHLWSDLWLVFCTCHLKLADTPEASAYQPLVCLWILLMHIYIDHRGILHNTDEQLNAKWLWSLVIRVRKQCESGSIEGSSILGKLINLQLESLSFITLITSCLGFGSCLTFCNINQLHVHGKKQEVLFSGTASRKCVIAGYM